MCRDHSDGSIMAILTLATENLPVKNTFIDLDIGTSAQLESAFKDSMNFSISRFHVFHIFLEFQKDSGGSNKWTMRVKAYRDLREVIRFCDPWLVQW